MIIQIYFMIGKHRHSLLKREDFVFFKILWMLLCFNFFLFPIISKAQSNQDINLQINSLKKILPTLHDSAKVDCFNAISFQYIRLLKRDSAEYFEALAFKESKSLQYSCGIAQSIANLSSIFNYFDNDFIKSESFARESISWFEKTTNKNGIENAYNNLFFALMAQSKYDEAYLIAQKKYEKSVLTKNIDLMLDALDGMGVIHYQQGNFDSAFYFYQKNYHLATEIKNEIWKSDDLIGLGTLYRAIGDYPTALKNYRNVFETDTRETIQSRIDAFNETWTRMEFAELFAMQNQFDSAWHYYNFFDTTTITDKDLRIYLASTGETFLLQKNYENALQNLLRALTMHRKLNDRNEIKRVLLDIAKAYFALNNNAAAVQYAAESLKISLETKSRQYIRDAYQIFYSVYDRLGQTDSAYFYYKKYIAIKDIVVSDQTKGKFAAYGYEEKLGLLNADKKIQQQQLKQTTLQKTFLIVVSCVILLLSVILIRLMILKRKNEAHRRENAENELQMQKLAGEMSESNYKQRTAELEMQALRAQMNPHFIFNSLNSINRFILQNNKAQASEYLTKFSRLVRLILQNSQAPLITLESELESLGLYLEMESLRFNYHFTYKISLPKDLDIEVLKVPPLIIQPYAENAIWHGLMHKEEKGQLDIEAWQEDGYLYFTITDNGIGRKQAAASASKSSTKHQSMGLRITADRIAMLQNTNSNGQPITINDLVNADGSPAGTEIIIKIPVIYD